MLSVACFLGHLSCLNDRNPHMFKLCLYQETTCDLIYDTQFYDSEKDVKALLSSDEAENLDRHLVKLSSSFVIRYHSK